MANGVILLTPEELAAIVEGAIARALAAAKAEPQPDMVTVAEAATMLRRSTRQIRRYIASGRLTATQATHGGHLLIARTEVEWLRDRKR